MALEQLIFDLGELKLNITAKMEGNGSSLYIVKASLGGKEYFARYDYDKEWFIDDIFGGIQLPNKTFIEQDILRRNVTETYAGLVRHGFISF
ncbi:MAG: hypothetical protein PHO02_01400 [Candidatus Nanoarchaeia archaeon]|nr:hypothetical protein [Candidatus Nanoarchaeia archaeon]